MIIFLLSSVIRSLSYRNTGCGNASPLESTMNRHIDMLSYTQGSFCIANPTFGQWEETPFFLWVQ